MPAEPAPADATPAAADAPATETTEAPAEPQPAPAAPEPAPEPAPTEASISTDDLTDATGEGNISVGVLLGLGTTFDSHPGGVDPFGFGFGVRGGYNLGDIFLGARFVNYVGSSSEVPTGTLSMGAWLLAVEAGYDLELAMFVLQPGVALGIASRSVDGPPLASGTGAFVPGVGDATHTGLYLAPGASLLMPLLDMFFVGADARLGFIIGEEFSGDFELLLTGGARF